MLNYSYMLVAPQKIFECQQLIPQPVDRVFEFFSNARNLEKITPPWLQFEVLSQSTPSIQENCIFEYRLKIKGVPVKWKSKIIDWTPNQKFIDVQLKGPYKIWHHTHEFQSTPEGTLMKDRVIYQVPFGLIGHFFVGPLISKDVQSIFGYRKQIIEKIFGKPK